MEVVAGVAVATEEVGMGMADVGAMMVDQVAIEAYMLGPSVELPV